MRKRLMLILFVALAATAGLGTRAALNSLSPEKQPAYTIVWEATDYYSDGRVIPNYTETRYVSSTGNWRAIRQYFDGRRSDESFGEVGRGVYLKRGEKLHFISEFTAPPALLSEQKLRASSSFLRADRVLGYTAIVVSPANSKSCSEFYRVPSLGGLTIKTVMCLDETGSKMVLEPVSLVLGEPDASLLQTPTELPVDYEHFKQTHP
ncbi:MAG: hypothetical protein M3447_11100 [Acidobacteriota bacterium]|nr:hypothetical protein [Acidobacteriota bacterium]